MTRGVIVEAIRAPHLAPDAVWVEITDGTDSLGLYLLTGRARVRCGDSLAVGELRALWRAKEPPVSGPRCVYLERLGRDLAPRPRVDRDYIAIPDGFRVTP